MDSKQFTALRVSLVSLTQALSLVLKVKVQSSKLKAQSSKLKAQSSKLKAQSSKLKAQSSKFMNWYPMYCTYGSELKVKAELDRLKVENYLPMVCQQV